MYNASDGRRSLLVYHMVGLSKRTKRVLGVLLILLLGLSTIACSHAYVSRLVKRLNCEDPNVRQSVADTLGRIGNSRAVGPLVACLKDEDWGVRMSAAAALGKIGSSRAVEPLIAYLKSGESYDYDRRSAADALGRIGKPAVKPLIVCLEDENSDVRKSTMEALGKIADSRAVEPLMACLKERDWGVRASAGAALGRIGEPAVEPLTTCLEDEDPDVRESAIRALGEIGDTLSVGPLIGCLRDRNALVRASATTALSRIGKPAVELLLACLKDDDKDVHSSAADALGRIGDCRAVEPLMTCLKDKSWYGRTDAVLALGKIGDSRAVEPLIACLDERRREGSLLGEDAMAALGMIGDCRAVEPLVACLSDTFWFARRSAADALSEIGDKRAIPHLVAALPDWDANDRLGMALEKLGWLPRTEAEQVYSWIARRNKHDLVGHWEQTKRILLSDARSGERRRVENAAYSLISLGQEEVMDELVRILDTEGDKDMAQAYLNCGRARLDKAARNWARRQGCAIIPGVGFESIGVGWGGW